MLVSAGLAQAVTLLIPEAVGSVKVLIFLLIFAASTMTGVSASEPFMRRAAERRHQRGTS
ncbi:hypothetical protein [Kitasatospora cineracea]|uniref:hypothetical protein n=1 Tax=Kitasatospora cineracea TaxID=88074 RepID=UPI00383017BF